MESGCHLAKGTENVFLFPPFSKFQCVFYDRDICVIEARVIQNISQHFQENHVYELESHIHQTHLFRVPGPSNVWSLHISSYKKSNEILIHACYHMTTLWKHSVQDARQKVIYSMFRFDEISRISKSIGIESRLVVAEDWEWGVGNNHLIVTGCFFEWWKCFKLQSGSIRTTLEMC